MAANGDGPPFSESPLLADRRAALREEAFSPDQRLAVVRQVATAFEGIYVHLPQKRALYGIDMVQRLRVLERQLHELTDAQFQAALARIVVELRDLHAVYTLPRPYRGFASLGILVEQYWHERQPHWIVSRVAGGLGVDDPSFAVGVELTHWNGSPIALAVAANAEQEPGGNRAARSARGLERMTQRPLALSPVPDEDWVDLTYRTGDGATHPVRLPWRVVTGAQLLNFDEEQALHGDLSPTAELDLRTELNQRLKKTLFAPKAVEAERRATANAGVPEADRVTVDPGDIATTRPHELRARRAVTAHGVFGYLRIYTFSPTQYPDVADNLDAFVKEVARLVALLPRDGLIVDVRANGGGQALAAEALLQYFTPRRIQSLPVQLVATPLTADLCSKVDELSAWRDSVGQALRIGGQYSAALPMFTAAQLNGVGQIYHGPVVLITDALCYSATDRFCAGFQDHGIGAVLGVDERTGAGGANVWTVTSLLTQWAQAPLEPLPRGADLRLSLRRNLRVGRRAGQPVEDLGVERDAEHRLTKRDVLEGNADLIDRAGEILAAGQRYTLDVVIAAQEPSALTLEVTTANLTDLDIYVDGRPVVAGTATGDGVHRIRVPIAGPAAVRAIRLEGFKDKALVAARALAHRV